MARLKIKVLVIYEQKCFVQIAFDAYRVVFVRMFWQALHYRVTFQVIDTPL